MTTGFPEGTWTDVVEAQRREAIEHITVSPMLPMGPRGEQGPVGAPGPSTQWLDGEGPPVFALEDGVGNFYLDTISGNVYRRDPDAWTQVSNIMGPPGEMGPTGPPGPPPTLDVGPVVLGGVGEAEVSITGGAGDYRLDFVVPQGERGPAGPSPQLVVGTVESLPPGSVPEVDIVGGAGSYTLNWRLVQGDTGPPGAGLKILGILDDVADLPPTGNSPGDAFLVDGHVWAWTGTEWIDVGPLQGPAGPQGPPGQSWRAVEFALNLQDSGDVATQVVTHTLSNPYPITRVLIEEQPGVWVDASTVHVAYLSPTQVRVSVDHSLLGSVGKLVLT